jgi:hypothetical protein
MVRTSPTIEGFRAAFRRPSLTFAEISWRWTLGSTAVASLMFYCVEYLNTLPVSNADATLLSTRHPVLVGRAITHILRGSLNRAVLAALLAALALSFLWIVAASVGRLATVSALFAYFREDLAWTASPKAPSAEKPRPIRVLIELNFLRTALVLSAILAFGGAAVLASFVSTNANPHPGLVIIMFLTISAMICMAGWALNWWLSLSGIFAVRGEENALAAMFVAVALARENIGSVLAVSVWTGLAHLVAFSIASTLVSLPLAFIRVVPMRLVLAGVLIVILAYFAVVDWLYIARLAGYVRIAEIPSALITTPIPAATLPGSASRVETSIDRSEPILSDLPNLAVET